MYCAVLWVRNGRGARGVNLYHYTFDKPIDFPLEEMQDNLELADRKDTQTTLKPGSNAVSGYLDIACTPGEESKEGVKKALDIFYEEYILDKWENPAEAHLEIDNVSYYLLFAVSTQYVGYEKSSICKGLKVAFENYYDKVTVKQQSLL